MRLGAIVAMVLGCCVGASADTSIVVDPLVSETHVSPGGTMTISVAVGSHSDQAERVVITPLDWRTRIDGSIAIEPLGSEGRRSLTPYCTLAVHQFILAPKEHRRIALTVALPTTLDPTPASYWGGFIVKATPVDQPPSTMGPAATVFVYNDVGTPKRHLTMQSLRTQLKAKGVLRISARYYNDRDGYLRTGAYLTITQSARVVVKQQIGLGTIFPKQLRVVDQTVTGLGPGVYHVELDVDYGGETVLVGETNATVP